MSSTPPVDTGFVMQEATRSELIQRKISMDALRKRVGDQATKEEKLRETCEGFESVFLQKMWEQMRKNVPKEGYLHSKDEETYQSMFDVELCTNMASAGGIGLADMLYEQLSQQLENTGRTTTPGSFRPPADIKPVTSLLPEKPKVETAVVNPKDKKLTAEELYSPIEEAPVVALVEEPGSAAGDGVLGALQELKVELGLAPKDPPGAAVREWAAMREAAVNASDQAQNVASAAPVGQASSKNTRAGSQKTDPTLLSWQGASNVSAKPRPISHFPRPNNAPSASEAGQASAPKRGMAPQETIWPVEGDNGVISGFGWEDNPATGQRQWNSGIKIAASAQTPVKAVLPGTVVFAGERDGQGNTIVIEHQNGFRSYYSNIQGNQVQTGDVVQRGADIAKVAVPDASSAQRENSSLHFELKKGEMALNPESAIKRS